MIPTREAKAQALRLSGLAGYDEREPEIERALQRSAGTLDHAARIVSSWLGSNAASLRAPLPAEIERLAAESDPEDDRRNWRCAPCDGTGFRTVYELHTWRSENRRDVEPISRQRYEALQSRVSGFVGEQMVTASVVRCEECALGRKRADDERADREKARQKRAAEGEKPERKSAKSERHKSNDWKRAAGGGDA